MVSVRRVAAITGLVLAVAACALFVRGAVAQNRAGSTNSTSAGSGFDLNDLDPTCQPCTDFFRYATGGWKKRNPIGPAYATWQRFSQIQEKNLAALRQILETATNSRPAPTASAPETLDQKLGDFYGACMDEKSIE